MKLLLTGGTGFFGRALLKLFVSTQPVEVTLLTRSPADFLNAYPQWAALPWLRLQAGDVTRADSLAPLVRHERFTHVLHAACDSTNTGGMTPLQRVDQIVTGTRNLLDLAARLGVPRFLLTSSGAVYGPQPPDLSSIPETYLGMPDPMLIGSAYGVAKRQAEHLCALYAESHGLETVVARCFAFVGEDLPLGAHFAIGNFIRDALERPAIHVEGNGRPLRSYMCQTDLARWLLALLQYGNASEAYNVGSNQAVSIEQLANLVRDTLAPDKPVDVRGRVQADNTQRQRYIPDITKARQSLGLEVQVSLQDAILKAAHRCAR